MRKILVAAGLLAACLVPSSARAQARNSEVQGFGGLTFASSALGNSTASTFGGRLAIGMTGNMQAIVEGGRMADVKSPIFDLVQFTPIGLRVSAWYGEGGVRFIASPHSAVRPYGEATAGFARLSTSVDGLAATTFLAGALDFLDSTKPMLGAGGGVVVQGGPLSIDLGYRYNKILAGNSVQSVLNLGRDFSVNQFRVGVGVRF